MLDLLPFFAIHKYNTNGYAALWNFPSSISSKANGGCLNNIYYCNTDLFARSKLLTGDTEAVQWNNLSDYTDKQNVLFMAVHLSAHSLAGCEGRPSGHDLHPGSWGIECGQTPPNKWKDTFYEQIQAFLTSIHTHLKVSYGLRTIFQSLRRSSLRLCALLWIFPSAKPRPGLSLSQFFPQSFSHRPRDGQCTTAALNPPH